MIGRVILVVVAANVAAFGLVWRRHKARQRETAAWLAVAGRRTRTPAVDTVAAMRGELDPRDYGALLAHAMDVDALGMGLR